ncbi:MAG: hypothetical protein PHV82_14510 [Victivallaceae bacterium]|nr:hypothetical protein [Victivallaceae bacterium]
MDYSSDSRNWNEFRWEKEIRQDEKRIRHYFRILPSCLDLPDEEDSIISKLMAQPDLVPSNADISNPENYLDIFFEDDEEHLDISDIKDRRDSEIYLDLHKLSVKWNILLVHDLRQSLRRQGMVTACTFGRVIARSIDVIELDETQIPEFRISLLKRILRGLNDLLGQINSFSRRQHSLRNKLDVFNHNLHNIREKVIKIIDETRAK